MPSLIAPALPAGTLNTIEQPEIEASGVVLRPWRLIDRDAVVAAYADPAIQRWHCRTMTPGEAEEWIARWPGRWQAESGAGWAITESSAVVGQVGLRRIELTEALAEVSYWVLPGARGRGLAGRALDALTRWSFATPKLHRIELNHSTANAASCAVATKGGFAAEGTRRSEALHADGWHDMHTHARLNTD